MINHKFTVSSGRMTGSYKERTYEYDVVAWIKKDEYTPHDQKIRKYIKPSQLTDAEAIYVKITGGSIPEGEEEYRYLWGPFFKQSQIAELLTDIFVYGSP